MLSKFGLFVDTLGLLSGYNPFARRRQGGRWRTYGPKRGNNRNPEGRLF
jgi:hypothetical protein